MALMFNICLSVDLILMLRYPFDKKESRMKFYWIISLILSITLTLTAICFDNEAVISFAVYGTLAVLVAYFCILIFSVIFACRKLSGPGMSKEVRGLLLKRYILAAFLYLIANIYLFAALSM